MNNSKKSNYGFTLIEIMVVVAIVGIFASIALPSFARLIESNRLNTATNELVSGLLYARSEALKRSSLVTLCPSTDQENCNTTGEYSKGWIIFLDCNENNASGETVAACGTSDGSNGEETLLQVHEGFDSLEIKNTTKKISFQFSGRLGGNSTFNINKKGGSVVKKRVRINRVGRVRSEKVKPIPDPE